MEWIEATENFPESMVGKLYEWTRNKEQYLGCKIQMLSISGGMITYAYPKQVEHSW